jgi:hypothetical protein
MEAWRRPSCCLPDNDALLARLSGLSPAQWAESRDVVMAFWTFDGRRKEWRQKRLVRERDYVAQKRASQQDKAAKRWKPDTKDDAPAMPEGMPEACPADAPTPTPTLSKKEPSGSFPETGVSGLKQKSLPKKRQSYPEAFEATWKAYPTTVNMSKAEGFKEWAKLDPEDQQNVAKAIPGFIAYCKATPDYRPVYFDRFVRQRRFDGYVTAATSSAPSEADWRRRLIYARDRRTWSVDDWGPMPGHDGCEVPPALLMAGDGNGWANHQRAA